MTKKLDFFIFLLLALSAVSARRAPSRPRRPTSSSVPSARPGNFNVDTFCEDNNVPEDIFFTYPWDCQWGVWCRKNDAGNIYTAYVECEDGEWFFQLDWRGKAETAFCDTILEDDVCTGAELFWPPCPGSWETFPVFHPSDQCDSYYFCVGGLPFLMQCGPGLHWNANRGFCDHPNRAGCENNWTPSPPKLPDCPGGQTLTLPHPANCELFIVCSNGNRIVSRCPHLHHFDIVQERCIVITQNPICLVESTSRPR